MSKLQDAQNGTAENQTVIDQANTKTEAPKRKIDEIREKAKQGVENGKAAKAQKRLDTLKEANEAAPAATKKGFRLGKTPKKILVGVATFGLILLIIGNFQQGEKNDNKEAFQQEMRDHMKKVNKVVEDNEKFKQEILGYEKIISEKMEVIKTLKLDSTRQAKSLVEKLAALAGLEDQLNNSFLKISRLTSRNSFLFKENRKIKEDYRVLTISVTKLQDSLLVANQINRRWSELYVEGHHPSYKDTIPTEYMNPSFVDPESASAVSED